MKKVIIFGSGGHAKVVADIIRSEGEYEISGFVSTEVAQGLQPMYTESQLVDLKISCGIVAVGDNWARSKVVEKVLKMIPQFEFIKAIHPKSVVSPLAQLGVGTVVMPGVVVGPEAKVGQHCILNTNSSLDHDSQMGDYASLAPGANCGGQVKIGSFSAIGLNAGIIHNVTVGDHAVLGAGSITLDDVQDFSVAYGIPSRIVRKREVGSKYL